MCSRKVGQAVALLAEQQDARKRKLCRFDRQCSLKVVDAEHWQILGHRPRGQLCGVGVMTHVLVAVGDHGPSPVPPTTTDDMHLLGKERVGRAHDRADVEVMVEVLDRDMERMSTQVKIGDDGVEPPVAIAIDHIAAVAFGEQDRVEAGVIWDRADPRSDTDFRWCRLTFHSGDDSLLRVHTATMVIHTLGPDIQATLEGFGNLAFWIVLGIIFAECGILIGFFLPGDSLLFITGLLIASGAISVNIFVACLLLFLAAVAGNITGYWIGHKAGPSLFNKPDSKLFRKEYVDKTHKFFERYGARAIILARFTPIVRTFITAIAGVARMDFRRFLVFSAIGGFLWAVGVTLAGYWLGNIEFVKKNIELILIAVVLVSVIPIGIEFVRHRRQRSAT